MSAYNEKEFSGTDYTRAKRKTPSDWGSVRVGYNYTDGEFGEILVEVHQPHGSIPQVALDKSRAMDLLAHLNNLLGNPLSHPATAAPSAD